MGGGGSYLFLSKFAVGAEESGLEDCFVASDALVGLRVEVVGRGKSAVGRAELGRGRLSVRSSVGFDPGSEPSVPRKMIFPNGLLTIKSMVDQSLLL